MAEAVLCRERKSIWRVASTGIATYPEAGQTVDSLMMHANMADASSEGASVAGHIISMMIAINLQANSLIEFETARPSVAP